MTVRERNQMALAFIRGHCGGCKGCDNGPSCPFWVVVQILKGHSWTNCEDCGDPTDADTHYCAGCAADRAAEEAEDSGELQPVAL